MSTRGYDETILLRGKLATNKITPNFPTPLGGWVELRSKHMYVIADCLKIENGSYWNSQGHSDRWCLDDSAVRNIASTVCGDVIARSRSRCCCCCLLLLLLCQSARKFDWIATMAGRKMTGMAIPGLTRPKKATSPSTLPHQYVQISTLCRPCFSRAIKLASHVRDYYPQTPVPDYHPPISASLHE